MNVYRLGELARLLGTSRVRLLELHHRGSITLSWTAANKYCASEHDLPNIRAALKES